MRTEGVQTWRQEHRSAGSSVLSCASEQRLGRTNGFDQPAPSVASKRHDGGRESSDGLSPAACRGLTWPHLTQRPAGGRGNTLLGASSPRFSCLSADTTPSTRQVVALSNFRHSPSTAVLIDITVQAARRATRSGRTRAMFACLVPRPRTVAKFRYPAFFPFLPQPAPITRPSATDSLVHRHPSRSGGCYDVLMTACAA